MSRAMLIPGNSKKLITAATSNVDIIPGVAALQQCRLHIFDKNSGLNFLIDSGSDISCIPVPRFCKEKTTPTNYLYAANNTKIPVYGDRMLNLNIGLRRDFRWKFVIANVSCPILGADFLSNFAILLDLNKSRLIDSLTGLSTKGELTKTTQSQIKLISDDSAFRTLFEKFPTLLNPIPNFKKPISHDTIHYIETTGPPLFSKPRRLHPKMLNEVKKEFQYLMDEGICRPSKSPWASPIHVVPKPDGSYRVCGDYRRLNSVTVPDRYPIPHIQDLTNILHGAKIFSKIDIVRAYFHIPVNEKDIPKTAVTTPFGSFEFLYLNFGLKCASNTFQRFINEVLSNLPFAIAYLDDILIFSNSETEHLEHINMVLERLSKYGLNVNISKSVFAQDSVSFLGHTISPSGIRPLPSKVEAIRSYPPPKTLSDLRRYIGLLNYFRRFISNAADRLYPLTDLLRGSGKKDNTVIEWSEDLSRAFEKSKEALTNAALVFPSPDGHLTLHADASDFGIGATLSLQTLDGLKPLAFFSKRFNETQSKYSTFDRELLAIYESVKHFRHLLEARECTIFTDHKPIVHAFTKRTDNYTNRESRWLSFISEFTSNIRFLNGVQNEAADALSRINEIRMPTLIDYSKLREDQEQDAELKNLIENNTSGLALKLITLPDSTHEIYCDISTGRARPYLTPEFRKQAFANIHRLSHPGIKSTVNLVRKRFIWPSMSKDCRIWARECLDCQRCKITKHTKTQLQKFDLPTSRFCHLNLDLIGPLPPSNGKTFCLTVIDRATRWPEAYPLSDISAQTIAKKLFSEWISRFGCPEKITSDQGRQFESQLFSQLAQLLGAKKFRTSPYHPQSNGLIENFHRPLKAAIKAHRTEKWTEVLPTILLGFRAALKADIQASPAELVYGTTLRLPGDFFDKTSALKNVETTVKELREMFNNFTPVPTKSHHTFKPFVPQEFNTCTHVFLRRDNSRIGLQAPYTGPYPVLRRRDKTFQILVNGKATYISLDRLKPAYGVNNEGSETASKTTAAPAQGAPRNEQIVAPAQERTVNKTRSGRTVRFPDRFLVS